MTPFPALPAHQAGLRPSGDTLIRSQHSVSNRMLRWVLLRDIGNPFVVLDFDVSDLTWTMTSLLLISLLTGPLSKNSGSNLAIFPFPGKVTKEAPIRSGGPRK